MEERAYSYRQKVWLGPLGIVLFGASTYYFIKKAQVNHDGLVMRRIIELSAQSATYFYWAVFLLSLILAILSLFAIYMFFKGPRQIVLSYSDLVAPKGFMSSSCINIPYKEIRSIQVQEVNQQKLLHVAHNRGKLIIAQTMFASKAAFEEFCLLLSSRV
ncbi:MAG: hypothetical protein ABIK92_03800 [Pseudomonadota bacterium]